MAQDETIGSQVQLEFELSSEILIYPDIAYSLGSWFPAA